MQDITVEQYWDNSLKKRFTNNQFKCNGDKYRKLYDKLKTYDLDNKSILEIGCGYCHFAFTFKWNNYTGLDLSKIGLEQAKKNLKNAKFIHGSIENYKPKKPYDIILAFDSLEHIPLNRNVSNNIIDCSHDNTLFIGNIPLVNSNHHKGKEIEHEMNELVLRRFLNNCRYYNIKTEIYFIPCSHPDLKVEFIPFMFFEANRRML